MIGALLLAALAAGSSVSAPATAGAAPKRIWTGEIGDPLPAARLPLLGGGELLLPLAGRPTVVNVFATWCGPCRMEMPILAREIAERYGGRVSVVGIDRGEPAEVVAPFVRSLGIGYPIALDRNRSFFRALSADGVGIPKTLLVDGSGRVVFRENGFVPGATLERLREAVERLLAEEAGSPAGSSHSVPPR